MATPLLLYRSPCFPQLLPEKNQPDCCPVFLPRLLILLSVKSQHTCEARKYYDPVYHNVLFGLHKAFIGLSRALNNSHFLLDWFLGGRGGVITTSRVLPPPCSEFLFYSVVILAWFPNFIQCYVKDALKYNCKIYSLSWNLFLFDSLKFKCQKSLKNA